MPLDAIDKMIAIRKRVTMTWKIRISLTIGESAPGGMDSDPADQAKVNEK
jgi:hypothetical protein